ncbi:MAG: Hpt domain-containing protein, partial [Alphaproteobacteria bacterium]|nr:Hpt domain-containing protein [Alphaproteobacteria bacterium]
MDAFEAIKATFFQECDELLAELESKLMLLEQGQTDLETINAVFRAVHSVKGGAGAFGLEALVRFAHVFETLMDELRAGRKPCDTVTIKTLLRASDVLADHIQAAQGLAPPVDEERSAGLVHELELLTHGGEAPPVVEEDEDDFGFVPMAFDVPLDEPLPSLGEPEAVAAEAQTGWRILFKPHGRMYGSANEAGLLLRELGRLGPITVSVDDSALPTLDVLVAEDGYLTWTIDLTAAIEEKVVREVFDFVEADCDLTISPLGGGSEPVLVFEEEPPAVLPASDELDIAALLAKAAGDAPAAEQPTPDAVALEAVAPAPVPAPAAPAAPAPAPAPVAAAPAPAAPIPPAQVAAPVAPAPVTIRVDLDRVDRLINVVGELVIQQAMLSQRVLESGLARSSGIALGLEDLELLTREIQDSVMAIRAQPVKSVFQRMPRLVREVADMVSKQVRLV